jgi:hypothetical protein
MQQPITRLPDVTELDWAASIAYAEAVVTEAKAPAHLASAIAAEALADLQELVVLMAAARQIVIWWELMVLEPARAYRGELAHAAERGGVAAMLAELAGERPHITAYVRAAEALADGAEWWYEGQHLVVQRVRGSRHVIGAVGACSCEAATWGRRCWGSAIGEALGRLERRRLAA